MSESRNESPAVESGAPRPMSGVRAASGDEMWAAISGESANIHPDAIAENRNWALGSAEGKPPYERAIGADNAI